MASNESSSNPVDTINGIRDEVLSQITKAQQIIDSFQEVSRQDGINVAIINPNDINKSQETLVAERKKVKDLQHTLAFTGAMNAGKSMILNAIIGARILPNRDTPMTSLPTVITHKPKQTQPKLYISDVESYNEAIVQIKQKWSAIEKSKSQSQFSITSELEETLDKLQKIDSILKEYCGESEVYNALFILSDVVRLCTKFQLDNPLEKYELIEQFPRIEIEFYSLKNIELDNPGVLSLIDSPGFNEVGQSKLGEIIENVLKDSSATVCVLDYTQLKGRDEQYIKESVQKTQNYAKSKLFVLINKFDQKTEHGLNENGVKQYVIEQLFPERKIENETLSVKDKVFCVSGKYAFFANMVIRAMTNHNSLPLPEKEGWVRDFANLAYVTSSRVEKELNDLSSEAHKTASKELWADSKIKQSLELIVEASLKEAAPECLQRALRKVKEIIQQLDQSIMFFNNGLNKGENDLKEILARLSSRLSEIPNTERELLSYTKEQMLVDLKDKTTEEVNEWKDNVIKEVDRWYSSPIGSEPKGLFFNFDLDKLYYKNRELIYNSLRRKEFVTEEEATDYFLTVYQTISSLLKTQITDQIDKINKSVQEEQKYLESKIEEKIKPIIQEEKNELKKEFDINLDIPLLKFVKVELRLPDIKHSAIERKKRDVESYHTDYKHIFWLWKIPVQKKYLKQENYYIVDPENIGAAIKDAANENSREIQQQISKYISEEFQSYLEKFFENISVVFKEVSFVINSSLELKNKSIKVQEEALNRGNLIQQDVTKLMKRNIDTREGLDESI